MLQLNIDQNSNESIYTKISKIGKFTSPPMKNIVCLILCLISFIITGEQLISRITHEAQRLEILSEKDEAVQCYYYHERNFRVSGKGKKFMKKSDNEYDDQLLAALGDLRHSEVFTHIRDILLKSEDQLTKEELDYKHKLHTRLLPLKQTIQSMRQAISKAGWAAYNLAILHIYMCYVCAHADLLEGNVPSFAHDEIDFFSKKDQALCKSHLQSLPVFKMSLITADRNDMLRLLLGSVNFETASANRKKTRIEQATPTTESIKQFWTGIGNNDDMRSASNNVNARTGKRHNYHEKGSSTPAKAKKGTNKRKGARAQDQRLLKTEAAGKREDDDVKQSKSSKVDMNRMQYEQVDEEDGESESESEKPTETEAANEGEETDGVQCLESPRKKSKANHDDTTPAVDADFLGNMLPFQQSAYVDPIAYALEKYRLEKPDFQKLVESLKAKKDADLLFGNCSKIPFFRIYNRDTWVDDDGINHIVGLLNKREENLSEYLGPRRPRLYFYASHSIEESDIKPYVDDHVQQHGHGKKTINPFLRDFLFFPANHRDSEKIIAGGGFHWSLVVVDVKSKTINSYDSMNFSCQTYMKKALNFIHKYAVARKFMNEAQAEISRKGWTFVTSDCPKQENSSDCGICTIMNMYYLADSLPLVYKAESINEYRELLAFLITRRIIIDPRYEEPKKTKSATADDVNDAAYVNDLTADTPFKSVVRITEPEATPDIIAQVSADAVRNVRQKLSEMSSEKRPTKSDIVTIRLAELEDMQKKIELLEHLLAIVPH